MFWKSLHRPIIQTSTENFLSVWLIAETLSAESLKLGLKLRETSTMKLKDLQKIIRLCSVPFTAAVTTSLRLKASNAT